LPGSLLPGMADVLQLNAFDPGLRQRRPPPSGHCRPRRRPTATWHADVNSVFEARGSRAGARPERFLVLRSSPAVKASTLISNSSPRPIGPGMELQQQGFDFCYDKRLYDRLEKEGADRCGFIFSPTWRIRKNCALHRKPRRAEGGCRLLTGSTACGRSGCIDPAAQNSFTRVSLKPRVRCRISGATAV